MIQAARPTQFTVSNGDLVLYLEAAGDGWYAVSSPIEPHLHTQAKSIEEAFEMAYDAVESLKTARAKYNDAVAAAMKSE